MRRMSGAVLGVALALILSALAASSASATLGLGCYKVDKEKGNWNSGCKTEAGILKGEWVLAKGTGITETPNLECVEIVGSLTGAYSDNKCTKTESNGKFTTVAIPSLPLGCYKVDGENTTLKEVIKGNWNKGCEKPEAGNLKGEYVLGKGTGFREASNLECVEIDGTVLTGGYKDKECKEQVTKAGEDGKFTTVVIPSLKCFKVDGENAEKVKIKGNWNKGCTKETKALEGEYVLGLSTGFKKGEHLECVFVDGPVLTGGYEDSECTKLVKSGEDGAFTTVEFELAGANCKNVTGSGSTLQTKQQEEWTTKWAEAGSPKCSAIVSVGYNKGVLGGIGSGQGLKEWGMPGKKLEPALSSYESLDGFVGTDDPPSRTLLLEGKEASESWVLTVPVVAAPVAVIVHLPVNEVEGAGKCHYEAPAKLEVTQKLLNELWAGKFKNWEEVLKDWKFPVVSAGCAEKEIKHKVRSDSSGTSYAFKLWLCQIEGGRTKCPTWEEKPEILSDAAVWPAGTKAETKTGANENKGSSGEIKAVEETAGSVGYVNFANAESEGGFVKYKAGELKFWLKIENKPGEFTEPGTSTGAGNCPTTLTAVQKEELPTIKAGEDTAEWEKFDLSSTAVEEGKYAGCTLTYDEAWEKYLTTLLKAAAAYGSEALAEETANTVKNYLLWVIGGTAGEGQTVIASGYTKLPSEVQKKAKEAVELIKT